MGAGRRGKGLEGGGRGEKVEEGEKGREREVLQCLSSSSK